MDFDSVVIGAGVVGLAVARALAFSGRSVLVLERHKFIGQETSSRNSEVIHAGIYYPSGSLKARLCVRGRELLYNYCDSHNVSFKRVGKLIVAAGDHQNTALELIYEKGRANGVDDLEFIDQDRLTEMEPALCATKAILSPSTGIINSHELMLAYQGDLERQGGILALSSPLIQGKKISGGFELEIGGEENSFISCRELINSAGLGAQEVSSHIKGIPADSIPKLYLSRGCYFSLAGKSPFSRLIYPLPNNEGLGVHLTLDQAGVARFGPDTEWVDTVDYTVDPSRGDAFYQAIREYYPAIRRESLHPSYAGIRPKIVGPGTAAGDFIIQSEELHSVPGFVGLYGIESPGLTASMAIGEYVLQKLEKRINSFSAEFPN
jgi:L-2-hydroxyglutarate oxidase LhgO